MLGSDHQVTHYLRMIYLFIYLFITGQERPPYRREGGESTNMNLLFIYLFIYLFMFVSPVFFPLHSMESMLWIVSTLIKYLVFYVNVLFSKETERRCGVGWVEKSEKRWGKGRGGWSEN